MTWSLEKCFHFVLLRWALEIYLGFDFQPTCVFRMLEEEPPDRNHKQPHANKFEALIKGFLRVTQHI